SSQVELINNLLRVRAEARGAAVVDWAGAVDADWAGQGLHGQAAAAGDGAGHTKDTERLVAQQRGPVENLRAPHVCRFEEGQPVQSRFGFQSLGQKLLELIASGERVPATDAAQGGQVEQIGELVERVHGDGEPAVGGAVDAVGRAEVRVAVADGLPIGRFAAVVEVRGEDFELEVDERFEQRGFDQSALTGDAAA